MFNLLFVAPKILRGFYNIKYKKWKVHYMWDVTLEESKRPQKEGVKYFYFYLTPISPRWGAICSPKTIYWVARIRQKCCCTHMRWIFKKCIHIGSLQKYCCIHLCRVLQKWMVTPNTIILGPSKLLPHKPVSDPQKMHSFLRIRHAPQWGKA